MKQILNCDTCGKEVFTSMPNTRFCSDKCRMRSYRKSLRVKITQSSLQKAVSKPNNHAGQDNVPGVPSAPALAPTPAKKISKGNLMGWLSSTGRACWCDKCLEIYLNEEGKEDGGYRRVETPSVQDSPSTKYCRERVFNGLFKKKIEEAGLSLTMTHKEMLEALVQAHNDKTLK
jgi:hypothetical protein